ncbi:MAG: GHKL domain-containing protein, partial [Nitrosomonadales bacterium]|nr:GHKL domain-containing protein [Nitrosomonadales bacterium]
RLNGKLNKEDQSVLSKATETIVGQVNALKVMVNEFSDYARQPVQKNNDVNINRLIESIIDLYEALGIDIQLKQSVHAVIVSGDENKLRQVFVNLLENSKDALIGEKKPSINITTKIRDGMAVIEFEDNGSGIPKKIISKIYEPYITSKSHGTGLGLAIVLKIIEEHKGSIVIKNKTIGGAKVSISIPVSKK